MIRSIVAYDMNRAIGRSNELLWRPGEMKNDMKRFRARTLGHAVIMGRKTYESIGVPLSKRRNIVVSRTLGSLEGIEVASRFDDALKLCSSEEEVYVIGGGQIYQAAMPHIHEVIATEVQNEFSGADTFFPSLDGTWNVNENELFPADENNKYSYKFVTYERQDK